MKKFIYLSILSLIFISVPNSTLKAQSEEVVVIVNANNSVENMSMAKVKLYFLRKTKRRWPENNKSIKPVDQHRTASIRLVFYNKVLKMSIEDVETYFVEKQISNAEKPPVIVDSDRKVINYVSEKEGGLGYVYKNSLSASDFKKIKIVIKLP